MIEMSQLHHILEEFISEQWNHLSNDFAALDTNNKMGDTGKCEHKDGTNSSNWKYGAKKLIT